MRDSSDIHEVVLTAPETPLDAPDKDIVIGLLNIMPKPAMQATERHFNTLLCRKIRARNVRIKLFTFRPDRLAADRQALDGEAVDGGYEGLDALLNASLDGLIVTGTEPRAAVMNEEPHWNELAALIDWAAENTISTIWSCFSAHAAAFRLDGIVRQPLGAKLSGVFDCAKVTEHAITARMPRHFRVPHSRYNTLNEDVLNAFGYTILSRSPRTGPDMFLKRQSNSAFLFLQGHPEYGQSTLLSEFGRDVSRFALGQKAICPDLPESYFQEDSAAALLALTSQMRSDPTALRQFNWPMVKIVDPDWQSPAQQLYAGWLSYIDERKSLSGDPGP